MMFTLISGTFIGIVLGLTGAGGGILAVPALMLGLGLSLPQASPIALTAVALAAVVGVAHGLRQGTVRYRAALLMAATGSLTAPLGSWLAHRLPGLLLNLMFVVVMLIVAWRMVGHARAADEPVADDTLPDKPGHVSATSGRFIWDRHTLATLSAIGGVSGVLTGMLGVGGGFFIVPAMRRYTGANMHHIIATSLMVIALVSIVTVLTAVAAGARFPTAAWYFIATAIIGMMVGRQLAPHLSAPLLQRAFALICLLVAAIMAWLSLQTALTPT